MSVGNSNRPLPPDVPNEAGHNPNSQAPDGKDSATTSTSPPLSISCPLDALPAEVWEWLLKDAERYAAGHISEFRWRGAKGGVLPGGFDASSLAAEAVLELFQPWESRTDQTVVGNCFLSDDSHDFLPASPLKPRVAESAPDDHEHEHALEEALKAAPEALRMPSGWESDCRKLREELHHRVRRQVNRLWHLKERLIMHNVEDLAPVQILGGETVSRDEAIPDPEPNPHESLNDQETRAQNQQRQEQFHAFLAKEPGLQSLYAALCAGIYHRHDLARTFKVKIPVIDNRMKRLRRRAAAFMKLSASERVQKNAENFASQIPHLQPLAKAA